MCGRRRKKMKGGVGEGRRKKMEEWCRGEIWRDEKKTQKIKIQDINI